MLSLPLLSAALLAAAQTASACQQTTDVPPIFWLANLRNSTSTVVGKTANVLASEPGMRLIRFEEGQAPVPITASEKEALERSGYRYFDVTEVDLEAEASTARVASSVAKITVPSGPTHQSVVNPIIATLSQSNLQSDLTALTTYTTRYYRSTSGATASNDLYTKLSSIAASNSLASVTKFTHSWGQNSIIAKIQGTNTAAASIIAGAHLDSINQNNPSSGTSKGADDNGSGCINLIEAFRKLVASSFKPKTTIEFHWYSGEEAGLLGSAAVAKSYGLSKVGAYLNLDMTAWLQSGTTPQIGFVSDRTDSSLTAFTKKLVTEYLTGVIPTDDNCGYACSDHASWYSLGAQTVYPFESITEYENPNIHTANDVASLSQFSFAHAHEFTKLVVAFVVELAA
ncbi:Zn-dependent exopeptidase [Atractiella rhizophila]|nr:Zn-dependent exopeptidase [Atractiella rhizophila]